MSKDLLVNFVIDESGSMHGQRTSTVAGFNSFIKNELEMGVGKTYVTVTCFNNTVRPVTVGQNATSLGLFGAGALNYTPNGGTALYDAMYVAIEGARQWVKNTGFKGKVLTVVWTDGYENASRQYNLFQVNQLIDKMKSKGWAFQFMGTGEDGWRQGQTFNMPNLHVNNVNPFGSAASYSTLNHSTTMLRSTGTYAGASQATYSQVLEDLQTGKAV